MSVARMRTKVVLPAPFGPSSPRTVPRSTVRLTPVSALVEPNALVIPKTSIMGVPGAGEEFTMMTLPR